MTDDQHPAAWTAALERFRDGYGSPFDPTDPTDVAGLLPILEREVYDRLSREMVGAFRTAAGRLRERLDEEVPR